jgi:hypothetical protein
VLGIDECMPGDAGERIQYASVADSARNELGLNHLTPLLVEALHGDGL